jgi:hypothetical protein
MPKFIISLAIVLSLATSSYAAPCYGTKMPEKKEIFLGLQYHTIYKRYLKDHYGTYRSMQDFLLLSYGIFDWLSIDLKGGVGNFKQRPETGSRIDYPTFLGGGYGLRLRLLDRQPVKMVLGFQHISVHPHTIFIGPVKHKAVLDDWQFSLLGSYSFKMITPYLGAKWSRADYIHWTDGERKREKSDSTRSVGLVFGFDVPLAKSFWINAEGQFLDGEAAAFSLNYSF